MNSLTWIGIIIWGVLLTVFGLLSAEPPTSGAEAPQPQDVVFLVAGGLLTCLIGITGLIGMMGWIPGLRKDEMSA